jgi:hypothetical protein
VHEWLVEDPLIPVREIAHTIPVAAIVVAMAAGAGSVALVQLAQTALQVKGSSPNHAGMLFWPEIGCALVAAFSFGRIIRTRWTAVFAAAGLGVIAGGAAVMSGAARGSDWLVVAGSGLVGFGVGSSVSPALFEAGFSLKSPLLPRVFAFVELLRGVAAFLVGPVVLQIAMVAKPPAAGLRTGMWIGAGIALAGLVTAAAIWLLGRARLSAPDVEPWMAGERPAIPSTPVAHAVRAARVERPERDLVH